ncbi:MAG: hypothetical protein NT087_05025 [Deltaproteobacteria bacterium]|nr:hypothetical protein [Deltaproteobacteria bacterium]
MERFLASIEKQAYQMAVIAVSNQDEALDLVQDAMKALNNGCDNLAATICTRLTAMAQGLARGHRSVALAGRVAHRQPGVILVVALCSGRVGLA